MPPTELYLIRHGRTAWNAEGRLQGAHETHLDEVGIAQAEALSHRFSDTPFSAIYSSHMRRARQTAEILAKPHQLPVLCSYELREGSWGPCDGMMRSEFYAVHDASLKIRDALPPQERFHFRVLEGCDTSAEILARALPCVQAISTRHGGEKIAVVTHGWVMRSLIVYLSGFVDNKVDVGNTAILHLRGLGEELSIVMHEGILRE